MHYTGFGARSQQTPQTEPIPGTNQQLNNTGVGFSFAVDDMTRLKRFILLGSSGGTFYVGERKLTKENLDAVERLLQAGRGKEVVDTIVSISDAGRAVSNDPALFALARCCACDVHGKISYLRPEKTYTIHLAHHPKLFEKFSEEGKSYSFEDGRVTWLRKGDTLLKTVKAATAPVQCDHADDIAVRQVAYAAVLKVARTGTHWLHFQEYEKQFRGRGRTHRRALKAWYNDKPVEQLAYQAVKYQQRDGWSQRDVLRLARPKPVDEGHNALYHWMTKGWEETSGVVPSEDALRLVWAFEKAKHVTDANEVADLILKYRLPREAVPTTSLSSVKVWEALLEDMPLEATVRNLATMTKNGVLVPMGAMTRAVCARLRSQEAIHKARLHPIKLLAALTTYQSGKSVRGSATWTPLREVIDALNDAFYLSFANVVPSGKRLLIAIDVSGSMHGTQINGIPGMNCHTAAGAMAMVTARSEQQYHVIGFDTSVRPMDISPTQRLDDVVRTIARYGGGGTDCSLPFAYVSAQKMDVDAFILLTDSESWFGNRHACQALDAYRQQINNQARFISVQMASTHVTLNAPDDALAFNVVGFDTAAPELISGFIRGEF